MNVKLDENFGERCAAELRERGHDVATVADQLMSGASDVDLIEICRVERRCLVTLDLDFANPLVFDPRKYSGIAVIRLKGRLEREELLMAIRTLATRLESADIAGKLWIVQPGRIREYQPDQ